MSTPSGPPRRRRIAGETKPGTAPAPAPARKPARAPKLRKSAPAPTEAPKKVPAAKQVPTEKPAPVTKQAPATEPAAPAEPKARRGLRVADWRGALPLVLVTVAALAFGGWFGYQGWQDWQSSRGVPSAHAEAAEAAASAAETIFGYRYDRLDEHLEDSQAVMTPSFAEEFETISPALNDLAPQRQIQVEASTREAAAVPCGNDCSTSRANVLVFVDQARLADGAEVPTVFGNRVQLTMVERDGRWLVDDVRAL